MANDTPTRSKACAHCGETFAYRVSRGSERRYCTPECRTARARAKAHAMRASRPTCRAEGCQNAARSSRAQWCEMHYYRLRRNGTLDPVGLTPTGHCLHCGQPTPSRQRIYCSSICQTRNRIGAAFSGRNCTVCGATIPHEDNYLRRYCGRPCQDLAARIRRYGMDLVDYRTMSEGQGGRCAICGSADERLVIDHCHTTNTVRGLLCGGCNAGIGMLREDPAILRSAIAYLR